MASIDDASESALALTIDELRRKSGAIELVLTDLSGQVIAYSNEDPTVLALSTLSSEIRQQMRSGDDYVGLDQEGDVLMVRVAVHDPMGRLVDPRRGSTPPRRGSARSQRS